jgi:hypothetical protein
MEPTRKELEELLRSLQPTGLSEQTLERLEQAVSGSFALDSSLSALEAQLQAQIPRALSDTTMDALMRTVRDVPFALDHKVVLFPGSHKEKTATQPQKQGLRRMLAVAAVATIGGLAALWTPVTPSNSTVTGNVNSIPSSPTTAFPLSDGIVATSFGTDIERADDEGVIWTDDHQPKRVLRFQYQDRVLLRDKNGVDRMLIIPREELFVVPEKVD